MSIGMYAAAAAVLAAAICFFKYRAARALLVFSCGKIGRAPTNSRLKNEWISPRRLEQTFAALAKRGFISLFPEEIVFPRLPAKPVLLAFMGGYQSFYTEVFPLLQKYNLKACVFLTQEYAGTFNAWQNPYKEAWQNLLTEKQIKELSKSGRVRFGALGLKAEDLTLLSPQEARFSAQENIFRLKKQLGLKTEAFAFWPAAKWDEKSAQKTLRGLEISAVLTPVPGVNPLPVKRPVYVKTLRPGTLRARAAVWFRR